MFYVPTRTKYSPWGKLQDYLLKAPMTQQTQHLSRTEPMLHHASLLGSDH